MCALPPLRKRLEGLTMRRAQGFLPERLTQQGDHEEQAQDMGRPGEAVSEALVKGWVRESLLQRSPSQQEPWVSR